MSTKNVRDRKTRKLAVAMLLLGLSLAGGCSHEESPPAATGGGLAEDPPAVADTKDESVTTSSPPAKEGVAQFAMVDKATASMEPVNDSGVTGTVTFMPGPQREKMRVKVALTGLSSGMHGIHVHEHGDCSGADAAAAGGHFDPYNVGHGGPDSGYHHVGDLGNIIASGQGRVDKELRFDYLAFSGPANILNRAVIVHASADDLQTDPAGGAGAPVACGVIIADRDLLQPEVNDAGGLR